MFGPDKDRFFDLTELMNGEVRPIDVIECNGRYSVNICSMGLDARVGTDVHKYSGMPLVGGARRATSSPSSPTTSRASPPP